MTHLKAAEAKKQQGAGAAPSAPVITRAHTRPDVRNRKASVDDITEQLQITARKLSGESSPSSEDSADVEELEEIR